MLDIISLILTIVGGLNWLLVGLFRFDLVAWIFGGQSALLSRVIYTLVGIAAVYANIVCRYRKACNGLSYSAKLTASNDSEIFVDYTEGTVNGILHLMNYALKKTVRH